MTIGALKYHISYRGIVIHAHTFIKNLYLSATDNAIKLCRRGFLVSARDVSLFKDISSQEPK